MISTKLIVYPSYVDMISKCAPRKAFCDSTNLFIIRQGVLGIVAVSMNKIE